MKLGEIDLSAGVFYNDLFFSGKMGKCQLLQHPFCNGIKLGEETLCWGLLSAPDPHTYGFAPVHHGLSWSRSCPSSGLAGSLSFSQPWSFSSGHWDLSAGHQ